MQFLHSLHLLGLTFLVTHFGAVVLLAPFSLLIALWLALRVGTRETLLWCACVAGVGGVIALGKIYLAACGIAPANIHSPSGHTAFASIAYGGFTVIAMSGSHSLRARLFRVGITLWVLLIGLSRVVIHAHTLPEVVVGWIVGGIAVAIFARLYRSRLRPPYVLAGGALLLIAVAALLMPQQVFTLENWLHQIAALLAPYRALICVSSQ